MPMLSLEGLVKIYGRKATVDRVSLSVESGSVVGLLGPNGAGKTTTFYMAVGIIRPDHGRVLLDGTDITPEALYLRARRGIGYLPQESSVFRKLTAYENVAAILEVRSYPAEKIPARAAELLAELGIGHLAERKAYLLSGGERRRLEIARALASEPSFLLLDEPFAGIDPLAVAEIQGIIRELSGRGIGVLISDHNVRETLSVCDFAFILHEGRVVESGAPSKVAESELVRKIYLGESFKL
ncbi:MAG: LPS export ABC transporter ATP-binding protein [Thermodesulfobacteriota bacterium]